MEPSRKLVNKVLPLFKNKYLLTFLIFLVWLVFFDQNNLLDRARQLHRHKELMQEKAFYTNKIKEDSVKLYQLKTNEENLEEFAREEYYMKKENEDIYIVVEE
jgi:cell division protein DivIC